MYATAKDGIHEPSQRTHRHLGSPVRGGCDCGAVEGDTMTDLVGTCPKGFWREWIAEGDAAGDPETGQEWSWYTQHSLIRQIRPGDRFYVVAHGRLRGWAPVVRVQLSPDGRGGEIVRSGNAVACTIADEIHGFRGLRVRWWDLQAEMPFPDWRTAGVIP